MGRLHAAAVGVVFMCGLAIAAACSPATKDRPSAAPGSVLVGGTGPPGASRLLVPVRIPGIRVERYDVPFRDITPQIPRNYRYSIISRLAAGDLRPRAYFFDRCGLSAFAVEALTEAGGETPFYLDGITGRFYTGIATGDASRRLARSDRVLLGWQEGIVPHDPEVSCDGVLVYVARQVSEQPRFAAFVADPRREQQFVITDVEGRLIRLHVSDDGARLVLSFPADGEYSRGTYVLRLVDWHVLAHFDAAPETILLSGDGARLYLHGGVRIDERKGDGSRSGFLYDLTTGREREISWPPGVFRLHLASSDLRFIARPIELFPTDRDGVVGSRGTVVQTPAGLFLISSPQRSLIPQSVGDDGSIVMQTGEILTFDGRIYRLASRTGLIVRIERPR